jgi:hypothetical protein
VLLHEQRVLEGRFYVGVAIILLAVFAHPLLARRGGRDAQPELLATAEAKNVAE